jgi:hypothetical protein
MTHYKRQTILIAAHEVVGFLLIRVLLDAVDANVGLPVLTDTLRQSLGLAPCHG